MSGCSGLVNSSRTVAWRRADLAGDARGRAKVRAQAGDTSDSGGSPNAHGRVRAVSQHAS